jgi:hypothetical protein
MSEAFRAKLDELGREHNSRIDVLGCRDRINDFRTGVWPPENYSLGNFRTGRDPERPPIRTARPHGD